MIDSSRLGIIVAARTSSSRLPGKVLKHVDSMPLILYILKRLKLSKYSSNLVLATSNHPSDDKLSKVVSEAGYKVYRGSLNDLVSRYLDVCTEFSFNYFVRITGDCPFVSYETLDYCVQFCANKSFDLASTKGLFPVGIDYEICNSSTISELNQLPLSPTEKEHLTLYIYNNCANYNLLSILPKPQWKSGSIFTVDYPKDLIYANKLASNIRSNQYDLSHLISIANQFFLN
jgi:spore coat polysaccharide biosynthesis protein SpsF